MSDKEKRKKEWLLNIATNRWHFNRPKYVGKVAEEIRKCSPKTLEDWINYYKANVKPDVYKSMIKHNTGLSIEQYLEYLGLELCKKIHENIRKEIEDIEDEDCISYIKELIFKRTFEGYIAEKHTVYGLLESKLNVKIKPAPDEWDRKYNIDFYIECKNGVIGIQIKPITYQQTPEVHKWINWLKESHERFQRDIGGKVFVIFSVKKEKGVKYIYNEAEVIKDIKEAIIFAGGPK